MNSAGLNRGTLSLTVEPVDVFYPTVKLFDLRGAKSFKLGENFGKIEGIVDLFNVFNASTVLSVNNQTGRDAAGPTSAASFRQSIRALPDWACAGRSKRLPLTTRMETNSIRVVH